MNTKMSIGIPIEIMLDITHTITRVGIVATIAPSNTPLGEIWLDLVYQIDNTYQCGAIKQISENVKAWNRAKYGASNAAEIFKKFMSDEL